MGTELALHLLDHDLTVWNRTPEKAQRLIDAGARFGKDTSNADVVITSLFGPDTVRKILPDIGDALWIDTTTVSPTDAATPVVGTLGPARAGKLGVYVGGPRAAEAAGIVRPWADPERLKIVETAAPSSHRKTPRQPRTRRQCSRPPRSPRPRTCSRVRVRRHPLHARLHWASLHQKHESPPSSSANAAPPPVISAQTPSPKTSASCSTPQIKISPQPAQHWPPWRTNSAQATGTKISQ